MIVLFTDFGLSGPYVGEMKAVLATHAPAIPVIDLMHDAPAFDPRASSYLLAALAERFPDGCIVIGVVDPGVGSNRLPVVVEADGRYYVGPDNGLFAMVARRAANKSARTIEWRPETLSASFHGRDLFCPVAAMIAQCKTVPGDEIDIAAIDRPDWPDDLAEIIHIDSYGNAMTGYRAENLPENAILGAAGKKFVRARTFSDVAPGEAF